ncbi:MAG: glycosidase, partial [Spirochaetales bacterium]|nr:glycosidase [Spirochaetales bacterium]
DRVALATTDDFKNYTRHGVIIPGLNDKDAVFFPERINGKMALLHRIPPDIQIVCFDSLEQMIGPEEAFWKEYNSSIEEHTILKRKYEWESKKIGAGPPPVKTEEGWLLIYHGVDNDHVYRTGVALLDLEDPSRVIARSPHPILEPEADYEKYGDVNDVVFPEGAIVLKDTLFIYYGGADKVCALATVKVKDLIDFLKEFR